MRIGAFELDCVFNAGFTLAEVACGAARLLRFARVRNLRGTQASWLKLYAEIDGRRTRQKSLRALALGDEARAAQLERDLQSELTVPGTLAPGRYAGRLRVFCDGDEERELPFEFEVLDADIIPTDFVRSRLLAAYIREDDGLRGFAARALEGVRADGAEDTLRGLYEALLERQLSYQPPVNLRYPDCQRVSDLSYVLGHGGSCADLSLLMASLLWCRGLNPALLLFPDHMAPGCFAGEAPAFETLEDSGAILRLADGGELALTEATALCSYRQEGYSQARRRILERLEAGSAPCQLINITRILREGGVTLLSRRVPSVRCPHCGCDRLTPDQITDGMCPACGRPLAPKPQPDDDSAAQPEVQNSSVVQYALQQGVAAVRRLLVPDAEQVRVSPVWQGRAVRRIGERALERGAVCRVLLPDSVTEIGDYAFYGCSRLERIRLPGDLRAVGTGAFCATGLSRIDIPGGVERISRLAFSGCDRLERVEIADGVRFIEDRAFADCGRLREVRIPASVERIGRNAFDPGCELLLASANTVVDI